MLRFSIHFPKFNEEPIQMVFEPGYHVIYGNSGVGKSQLIRSILDKKRVAHVRNFTISNISVMDDLTYIPQNPDNYIISPTIGEELAFSLENECNSIGELKRNIDNVKKELPFEPSMEQNPITLSGGEKELLNITTGLSLKHQCILLDDGLSFLSNDAKSACVNKFIEYAEKHSAVVILFSSELGDLKHGKTSWELTLSGLKRFVVHERPQYSVSKLPKGVANLKLDKISFGYDSTIIFDSLSTEAHSFRSLGLFGKNGTGKTTLAQLIHRIQKPSDGHISLTLDDANVGEMAYLNQFPEKLLLGHSLNEFCSQLLEQKKLNTHLVSTFKKRIKRFSIDWDSISHLDASDIPWSTLRLTMVILLTHCEYDVFILDEPSFGLGWDQKVILKQYLIEIMQHKHFLIISHDHLFLSAVCDQIFDLDTGKCKTKNTIHEWT